MTHKSAVCQEQYELVLAQIKERLSLKVLESPNRSLDVLRAKAWLSKNYQLPNNVLDFNSHKEKK